MKTAPIYAELLFRIALLEFDKATKTIDIDVQLVAYMIDELNDKVSTAVAAVGGGTWSTREGILFAGNAERLEEKLAEIKEEQEAKNAPIGKTEQKPALIYKNCGDYNFSIRKKECLSWEERKTQRKKVKAVRLPLGWR